MAEREIHLDIEIAEGLSKRPKPVAPDWLAGLGKLPADWSDQVSPWTGARWPDGNLNLATLGAIGHGQTGFRHFILVQRQTFRPEEGLEEPAAGVIQHLQVAPPPEAEPGVITGGPEILPTIPEVPLFTHNLTYLPQHAYLTRSPGEGIWIATVALQHGGEYTFWQGFHFDGGRNFGYDEPIGDINLGLALLGIQPDDAFGTTVFGVDTHNHGPPTFGGYGDGSVEIDLTVSGQHDLVGDPIDYDPRQGGTEIIVIFPVDHDVPAVAVISAESTRTGTDGSPDSIITIPADIVLPTDWTVIDSEINGSVLGQLVMGIIPAGATTLTFERTSAIQGEIYVSLIAFPNITGMVEKVGDPSFFSGEIIDQTIPGQIQLRTTDNPDLIYADTPTF